MLAKRGARLAILDTDDEQGQKLGQELGALFCTVDVTRDNDIEAAVAGVVAEYGPPQILVNAAGLAAPYRRTVGRRGAYPMDVFRKIVDVNLNGTFLCASRFGAAMAENEPMAPGERGVIINVASITAFDGPIGTVAYAAAKAGVLGMTITMARDLAHLGIRVCTIAPGSFDTPMMRNQSEAQAQVDFARFVVAFADEPGTNRIVWLFSLVLGHSRFLFARYVLHQDLQNSAALPYAGFRRAGGCAAEILYDRMKTAVTGEDGLGHIVYNRALLALAAHYRFQPRACRPYRAKTKGKVERPFSYIRQDFFLARSFQNLEDMNDQLIDWLDTVANARLHGTTHRIVAEAFAAEQNELQTLPEHPYGAVLKLERRVSHDGLVSIGGNYYSVPDRTRRVVEIQQMPDRIRILDHGKVVAEHRVLEGRKQYLIDPGHRTGGSTKSKMSSAADITLGRIGEHVPARSLAVYQAIGAQLAHGDRP